MEYVQLWIRRSAVVVGILAALALGLGCTAHKSDQVAVKSPAKADADASLTTPEKKTDRTVQAVTLETGEDSLTVWIHGSEALEYTSIKQTFPFAISVYLPDTKMAKGLSPSRADDNRISGIRLGYANKEETTVKVDILLTADAPYTVEAKERSLGVVLKNPEPTQALPAAQTQVPATGVNSDPALVIPDTPAEITHVAFDSLPSGHSDISIETSHPVRYETRQVSPSQLNLVLFNTRIPKVHQRPFLTRYFNSAVERVLPGPVPGAEKDSQLTITIREQVPFRLVQDQQGIKMAFEPSGVKPPLFDKARVETRAPIHQAPLAAGAGTQPAPASAADSINEMVGGNKVYTGEKIKLDFYGTDIKNVFRILRSVSGLNFAVDDDVEGKVTLSLEQPVPWDQVMDLVLKMNGLGKKMEGNVVRIATLKTLRDEEKSIQDAIAARKESLEQQKSLEPLITEYIPINYSDAKKDIEPHVSQILTPERGKISVDERTNMVIITDTQTKIDQANDLIYRLDTVTPQIVIEARVVEVTKEFARNLGVEWNLSNASSVTSGFVNDFSVAVNSPNTGLSGDFSFFRLFGSSMAALNAKLEASEESGDVRIVSSPRILTLDNKKAKIKQGQEVAYLERDDAGGSSVKFKEVDLLLEVTPHVTPDRRIAMTVYLTKNDVSGFTSTGVPTIATNEAETELLVNNNDTVVIGGVVKTTKGEDNSGLPFLSGIPVLGQIFGKKQERDDRNELLIFLTPSIVQLEQKRHTRSSAVN